MFWDFSRFSVTGAHNLFLDSKSTHRTLNALEATSWHKNQNKKIKWSFYRGNNNHDSKKQKETESKKIMGCLPKVLFFIVF